MQPIHGGLCTFWLTALVCALERAASLQAAVVPMMQLIGFIWTYTGAAMPRKLQPRLLAAIRKLQHAAPAGTEPQHIEFDQLELWRPASNQTAEPYVDPQRVCMRAALGAVVATDPVLSALPQAKPLRTRFHRLTAGAVHRDAFPLEVVVAMHDVLHRLYQAMCQSSLHSAGPLDTALSMLCSWRGFGLVCSPYGIMHQRAAAQRIVRDVLQRPLPELVLSSKAYIMARVNALSHEHPIRSEAPARQERYARYKKEWDGQLVAVQQWRQPVLRLAEVARLMRARGATHMPVLTFVRGCEELRELPHELKESKFVVGKSYCELLGWGRAELPTSLPDGLVVEKYADVKRCQSMHAAAILTDCGEPFTSVLDAEQSTPSAPLPSLRLAPLASATEE